MVKMDEQISELPIVDIALVIKYCQDLSSTLNVSLFSPKVLMGCDEIAETAPKPLVIHPIIS